MKKFILILLAVSDFAYGSRNDPLKNLEARFFRFFEEQTLTKDIDHNKHVTAVWSLYRLYSYFSYTLPQEKKSSLRLISPIIQNFFSNSDFASIALEAEKKYLRYYLKFQDHLSGSFSEPEQELLVYLLDHFDDIFIPAYESVMSLPNAYFPRDVVIDDLKNLKDNIIKYNPHYSDYLILHPYLEYELKKYGKFEKFKSEKKWQEALWLADELNLSDEVLNLEKKLKTMIASETPKYFDHKNQGYSFSFLSEFQDGTTAIGKPHYWNYYNPVSWIYGNNWASNTHTEEAAYRLDRYFRFNLVPFTTQKSWFGVSYSFQYFLKDIMSGASFFRKKKYCLSCPGYWSLQPRNALIKLVSDYIFDNIDNHQANWLYWEGEHRLISIDHSFCFTTKITKNHPYFGSWNEAFNKKTCKFKGRETLDLKRLPKRVKDSILNHQPQDIDQILYEYKDIDSKKILERVQAIKQCLEFPPEIECLSCDDFSLKEENLIFGKSQAIYEDIYSF